MESHMAGPDSDREEIIARAIERHQHEPGALLPILHEIQDHCGYVPPSAVPAIARGLNLSRADVHGVISFYHGFRTTPPGRHVVQICRAEACQAMGSRALEDSARARLAIDFAETTPDRAVSLEGVYCFGNCACAPTVMIDGELHGRMNPEALGALLGGLAGR
jgi:formate dehydrogenase subunit gamma